MVNCDGCGKKISFLSQKFNCLDISGKTLIYCFDCNHDCETKENKKKELELKKQENKVRVKNNGIRNEIYEKIQSLFENSEEKKYAKSIFQNILNQGEYLESMNDFSYLVGYKSKVFRKLRELDLLKKDIFKEYTINISELINYDIDDEITTKQLQKVLILVEKAIVIENNLKKENLDKIYICSTCTYKWQSKKKIGEPFKCPSCSSSSIINLKELNGILKNNTNHFKMKHR